MEIQWPLIIFTFFLCLSGGIMAVQGFLILLQRGKSLQNLSLITSAAALLIGTGAVMLHLHHWDRIFNAFSTLLGSNAERISGITLVLWGCVIFAVVLLLYFLFMRRSEDGLAPKWCAVLGMVTGLALAVVVGYAFTMLSLSSWRSPLFIAYFACNAALLGSLTVAIAAYIKKDDEAGSLSMKISLIFAAASAVLIIVAVLTTNSPDAAAKSSSMQYFLDPTSLSRQTSTPTQSTNAILSGPLAGYFWGVAIVVGVGAPMACAIFAGLRNQRGGLAAAIISALCAVVGSFVWRCIIYASVINASSMF